MDYTPSGRLSPTKTALGVKNMWLWWLANAIILVVVIPLVVILANRVIRPAVEIQAYSDDILEHGVNLTVNLTPVPALIETDAKIADITGEAVRYVAALRRMV
ncbi:MAG: hypothetical protein GXP35_01840 [Actinobacteria bacterium]|nr:hypothetical protein [Actinomycetota bacterium]